MKRIFVSGLVVWMAMSMATAARAEQVTSPDGKTVVTLELVDGQPTWRIDHDGQAVLKRGALGVAVKPRAIGKLAAVKLDRADHHEVVKLPWGKFAAYRNDYHEAAWTLREAGDAGRVLRIVARVYDRGVGVRYEFPEDGGWGSSITLADDATEFCFAEDGTCWSYLQERSPKGPMAISAMAASKGGNPPMTVRNADGLHMAVMEAAIFDIAPFTLVAADSGGACVRATFDESMLAAGGHTSWRVLLIEPEAGGLLTSPVLYCLNPAPPEGITGDWVKPGAAMWDWREWGAKTDDGFTYGLDMPSWRRMIDFAGKRGVAYVVLDAGWYGDEWSKDSDPQTNRDYLLVQPDPNSPKLERRPAPENWKDPIDIPELIQYAKKRNVGIVLYFNDLAADHSPLGETLALYEKWGAAGIKYGFMKAKGQAKVRKTREIIAMCAKHHLICDFHDGPIPPSGDERTYPNYVAREFCHAQSDALRSFGPEDFCKTVFVNMLAGPLDMNNGMFTLKDPAADRPKVFKNIDTTIVAETARVLITYSGLAILPDTAEAYEAKADLFEFIGKLPMTWDQTRIINGKVGEYITTARQAGDAWYIASATNDSGRTLDVKLDFLTPGVTYDVTLYEDAPDAHYKTNREAYQVRHAKAKRGDVIQAKLAPGGGHCMLLTPAR
ncbi:glycoside hydrolase family 97 protein [Planctomycetales bacterium ZRK34]|nr:glycoside hydrolase family 97 protein [Planctomycetales bacterium ZRK34]